MAKQQNFKFPDSIDSKLRPWVERYAKQEDWGNAREMRTLLEKARETQAMRISSDPSADLTTLETADIL